MRSRREFLVQGIQTAAAALLTARQSLDAQGATQPVSSATAITQVSGDGQKLTAVALDYGRAIDGKKLSASTFQVENRTITKVYASESPTIGLERSSGRYVIVELSADDPAAALISSPAGGGPQGPRGAGPSDEPRDRAGAGGPPQPVGPGGPAGPEGGRPGGFPSPTLKAPEAAIFQTDSVTTSDGKILPPNAAPVVTTHVRNLIVDDFKQLTYRDPHGRGEISYNLFIPRNYDRNKKYPLVLFIHDAGTLSSNPRVTLAQGLGAVIWASPEDQAKRECFVLAPQFNSVTLDERSATTPAIEMTIALVREIAGQYSIDTNRLYTTGQSMGAMMSIAMNIAYPGFFAASYLVAGQWDEEKSRSLAKDKLWIVVSQGDLRAYPGENAMTAVWEKEGAKISRAVWDGRSTAEEFASCVNEMTAKRTPINYVALKKGTVVPRGQADDGGSNHINTWRIAYNIEGIRDWLFRQQK